MPLLGRNLGSSPEAGKLRSVGSRDKSSGERNPKLNAGCFAAVHFRLGDIDLVPAKRRALANHGMMVN